MCVPSVRMGAPPLLSLQGSGCEHLCRACSAPAPGACLPHVEAAAGPWQLRPQSTVPSTTSALRSTVTMPDRM